MSGCRARMESAARKTAARWAPTATVVSPTVTEVGFHQLVRASPLAFPTGTRPDAIPPTAAPRKNGTSTDDSANVPPRTRASAIVAASPLSANADPRKMIPIAAANNGT